MTAKQGEMGRGPLRVVEDEAALFEPPLQMREGHLRGLGFAAEHAFSKECTADGHTIDSADEPTRAPDFSAVGVAEPVQFLIAVEDGVGDGLSMELRQ